MSSFHLQFITPLFSRGAYEDRPEIRAASIRGQLHWWFRALGGSFPLEQEVFGGIGKNGKASKVVVRVADVTGQTMKINTLPHKGGGQASPKAAYAIGSGFDLHVLTRLGGLKGQAAEHFDRTLEAWLLVGSLGLRSTRAAGNFIWSTADDQAPQPPVDFDAFEMRVKELLKGAPLSFALLHQVYTSAEEARRVVSDTLGGRDDKAGQDSLAQIHHPLGKVFGGRKTSPLRFRIVGLEGSFRIAAIWDARTQVTGNTDSDFRSVIALLARQKPSLGQRLETAFRPLNSAGGQH